MRFIQKENDAGMKMKQITTKQKSNRAKAKDRQKLGEVEMGGYSLATVAGSCSSIRASNFM
jgi:hypothetical protein